MGLNFQYYDGLQPKIRAGIINEHECIPIVCTISKVCTVPKVCIIPKVYTIPKVCTKLDEFLPHIFAMKFCHEYLP